MCSYIALSSVFDLVDRRDIDCVNKEVTLELQLGYIMGLPKVEGGKFCLSSLTAKKCSELVYVPGVLSANGLSGMFQQPLANLGLCLLAYARCR